MEVVVLFPPRELANLLEPPMIARYGKFRHLFAIGGGNGSAGTRKNQIADRGQSGFTDITACAGGQGGSERNRLRRRSLMALPCCSGRAIRCSIKDPMAPFVCW